MPDIFRFDGPRRIEPAFPHYLDDPWLELGETTDDDRPQLLELLRRLDPTITDERLLRESARELFVGPLEGFEEAPVEVWDVVDEESFIRYTLWLCAYDTGLLFEAGTTRVVAEIARTFFYPDDAAVDIDGRELTAALERAKKSALVQYPKAELAGVVFVRSYTY